MARRKNDKKISVLEPFFESIFVCNDKKLRPFIEVFVQEPENVTQQNLGTLLGIFEITDFSEDSSYIVNYLISVIKKEYSSRPKRGAIESFEAALHKANLALSKLAEHGNIRWIGKLNALVAVIEKNNLHLSQSGTASAFLLRFKSLTDISEGLATEEAEPHPLKTFVNISSGRLEADDKIIVTTDGMFNIFSLEEIKKSALRFPGEKFIQFLKTALGNELERAGVLVVDLKEREEAVPAAVPEKEPAVNAFSSSAFARPSAPARAAEEVVPAEPAPAQAEKDPQRTGHLYIKGADSPLPETSRTAEFFVVFREAAGNFFRKTWKLLKRAAVAAVNKIKTIKLSKPKPAVLEESRPEIAPEPKTEPEPEPEPERELPAPAPNGNLLLDTRAYMDEDRHLLQKTAAFWQIFGRKLLSGWRGLWPNLSRIKAIVARLDYTQRLYAVLILAAIILVPAATLKIKSYLDQKKMQPAAEAPLVVPLAQDKNVARLDNLNTAYSGENILSAVNLAGKIFGVTQKQIIDLASQETFAIPEDFGQIRITAAMDDLNLIFLMNQNNKTIAWSPVAKKFQDNALTVPDGSDITVAGTYLTYMYLLDGKNSQIYRYPRAAGGFGGKADWLKDSVDLSQATGLALSENIYVADGSNILKLFKGKKQDFQLEASATPIAPYKVYIKQNMQNIYVLDKNNSRLIKLDLNGQIISQYYNYQIGNANDFTVDEQNNIAYVSTPSGIYSFPSN